MKKELTRLDKLKLEIEKVQNNPQQFKEGGKIMRSSDENGTMEWADIEESADIYNKNNVMTDEQHSAFDGDGEPLKDIIQKTDKRNINKRIYDDPTYFPPMIEGVESRYAKKRINPDFYGKIEVGVPAWNCAHNSNWDYLGWEGNSSYKGVQSDWISTLITKVNEISGEINMSTLRGGANKIDVHTKLKPLFESIKYYLSNENDSNGKLGARYDVNFSSDIPENTIRIYRENENDEKGGYMLIPTAPTSPEPTGETFKLLGSLDEIPEMSMKLYHTERDKEVVDDYLRKGRGSILIHNFTDEKRNELLEYLIRGEEKSFVIDKDTLMSAKNIELSELFKGSEETDNSKLLKRYQKSFDNSKGMLFYCVNLHNWESTKPKDQYSKVAKEMYKDGVMMKTLMIDLKDTHNTLKKMDEITSKSNFVKWACEGIVPEKKTFDGIQNKRETINERLGATGIEKNRKTEKDYGSLLGVKKPLVEPNVFNSKYNPQNLDEDYFLTTRSNTKYLKTTFSPELAQDLQRFHNIDAEGELRRMLVKSLINELSSKEGEALANIKTTDELFVAMESIGYKLGPTIYDPANFVPKKRWFKKEK